MSITNRRTRLGVEVLEGRALPAAGLQATYFDNVNFTGAAVTRVDPTVNFDWGTKRPAAGIGADTFSARWTGAIRPRFTETYTFSTITDEGVRLWVDGRLVIDHWARHSAVEDRGSIALTAGRWYDVRLEYYDQSGKATAKLLWTSPSQRREVVPSTALTTTPPAPPPAPPPAAPTSLTAVATSPSAARLTWTDASTNETGFVVERSPDGVTFTPIATTAANATAYDDSGLAAGTTYSYRVRAVNAVGSSAPSGVATAQTPTPTPTPTPTVVYVGTTAEFRAAVNAATPGTQILLRPGVYDGGNYFSNVRGEDGRPVVIGAADPANRPVIRGGAEGLHFSDPAYLEVRDLIVEGAGDNGINIDDADTYDTPAHHVVLRNLWVRNVGAGGNQDGIKLSGVQQFLVAGCVIEAWGAWGSGIDVVGSRDGIISGSTFRNGDSVGANGVQIKGGSTGVAVRDNRFEHAGMRAVQVGGSTDLVYFRPQPPAGYEAKDVTVEGNVIIGSEGAVAFVNVDGATVRFNTIYRPTRYAFRILQETTAPGFVPSRNGVVTDNIVAFQAGELMGAVNVGPYTAPETFQFARNWWYCINNPAASVPQLPVPEAGGTYGVDPQFADPAAGDLHLRAGSPAAAVGAYAPRP